LKRPMTAVLPTEVGGHVGGEAEVVCGSPAEGVAVVAVGGRVGLGAGPGVSAVAERTGSSCRVAAVLGKARPSGEDTVEGGVGDGDAGARIEKEPPQRSALWL